MKFVPSYVKARVLTHDPAQRIRHEQDTLISHAHLHQSPARSARHRHAADPGRRGDTRSHALMLVAGSDWVVEPAAQMQFFERLGSPVKHLEMLHGYYHDVYHEQDAERPLQLTRAFIEGAFVQPGGRHAAARCPREGLHLRGVPRAVAAADARSRPSGSSTRSFGLFLRTLGRWSDGIRLGWESGFNSGRTLDYVYRNRAGGFTPLGPDHRSRTTSTAPAGAAFGFAAGCSSGSCSRPSRRCTRGSDPCISWTSPRARAATCWRP